MLTAIAPTKVIEEHNLVLYPLGGWSFRFCKHFAMMKKLPIRTPKIKVTLSVDAVSKQDVPRALVD
jgi:methyl coenzyme M reductase subunit C-like uncharacterized protein (methanogenesis marker protein 7)